LCREENASNLDLVWFNVNDRRKIIIDILECVEKREKRARWHGFDDQFVSLFAHDGVIARQLEFTGDSNRLVSPILEKLDVSLRRQNSHLAQSVGICRSICLFMSFANCGTGLLLAKRYPAVFGGL
jgi:hypothetical protein